MAMSATRTITASLLGGMLALAGCSAATPTAPATMSPTPVATPTPVQATATATPRPAPTAPPSPTVSAAPTAAPAATPTAAPTATATASPASTGPVALRVETLAGGLVAPWALAFAPDGRLFVTERPGRVRVIKEGRLLPDPAATIADVAAEGEAGLLGLALAPDFAASRSVYLYYTYRAAGGLRNRVVRYGEQGDRLVGPPRVIIDGIPGAGLHDGGRIAFGPDGKLYITTGDATQPALAQDRASPAGKILRLNADGSVPADNPFPGSPVYSLGHRNPQGLAWHPQTGRLYATEHGAAANDEVNLIEAGQNYGWPQAQGTNHAPPFRAPVALYTSTVAPSGATFYDGAAIPQWRGSLLFAALRGTHLHRLALAPDDPGRAAGEERLYDGAYGRLRDVVQGPDGAVYVATSNRDGRGSPRGEDDRILRIGPA